MVDGSNEHRNALDVLVLPCYFFISYVAAPGPVLGH